MKPTVVTDTPTELAMEVPASYVRRVMPQHVGANAVPSGLHAAMALRRALASTQRDLFAALQQVALLTETNARLSLRSVDREQGSTKTRRDPPYDVSGGAPLSKPTRAVPLANDCPNIDARSSTWRLADFGLFAGLTPGTMLEVGRLLAKRIRLRKGDVLYRVGGQFSALYAIRTGSCKTLMLAKDGHEQIAGYYMTGEIIGLDGISTEFHECQATAMEDTEVCPLPYDEIGKLAHRDEHFQHNMYQMLMQRYARARTLMIALGTMSAEQRIAMFLLDLSQRHGARGYSTCEFVLRMTREEIGSYLGLKLETVSRLFSRLQREGLLQVEGRTVKLLDRVALNRLVEGGA